MSFVNKMFKYDPTGSFSFEFFKRISDSTELGDSLYEHYFLLPPEEYSMQEGYKVTLNKTVGGGWVDDFGNDFKKIKLSGSLFSFYFGSPNKKTSSILNDFNQAISGFTGHAGIDEFLLLRFLVSRLRDEKDPSIPAKLLFNFPKLSSIKAALLMMDGWNWETMGVVYHDYDDDNHYEVIFDDFSFSRSKDDPFTVKYNIEMTAIAQQKSDLKMFGKIGAGVKETFNSWVKSSKDTFSSMLEILDSILVDTKEISRVPLQFYQDLISLKDTMNSFADDIENFAKGVKNDYKNVQSVAKINADNVASKKDILINQNSQITMNDLENDTEDLPDNILDTYNSLIQSQETYIGLISLDVYANDSTVESIVLQDDAQVEDTDFNSENVNEEKKNLTEITYYYHTVEQDETLFSIAKKFFGTYLKSQIIGQVNNLKNEDFNDDALVGSVIKIPILNRNKGQLNTNYNLVYTKINQLSSPRERQLRILGTDIKLDFERGFVADSLGDLSIEYGENAYVENISDRLSFFRGSLSELHPEWGLSLLTGNIFSSIMFRKILDSITNQIEIDPRTQYVYIEEDKIDIDGDTLRIPARIKPLTGSETILDIGKIIPGQLLQGAV